MAVRGDAVLGEFAFRRGINWVTDFFAAGGRGGYFELGAKDLATDHVAEDEFSHWGSAYISMTDHEYLDNS